MTRLPLVLAWLAACSPISERDLELRYDMDGDGVGWEQDCDDEDAEVGEAGVWFPDEDGDGQGLTAGALVRCTGPDGFVAVSGDCDDRNAAVYAGSPEICNEIDDDCDGTVDEATPGGSTRWYFDDDGDGYGGDRLAGEACVGEAGWTAADGDCDDSNPTVHPHADERCGDLVDNDCDGSVDGADAVDAVTWFGDLDQDGFGDPFDQQISCEAPEHYVANGGDCDDADPAIHPLAPELCDGLDNNCNTLSDDDDPWLTDAPSWYEDADGDGFGSGVVRNVGCGLPPGFADNALDCADGIAAIHPGASERCDGIDNDCDGLIDAQDHDLDASTAPLWFPDEDADGFGGPGPAVRACGQPVLHVRGSSDCDDQNGDVWPGAPELCDERDNDCDQIVDEDLPTVWFPDQDGDGFGTLTGLPIAQCDPIPGYSAVLADCDDAVAAIFPGAVEICDAIDNDCDGMIDDGDDNVVATLWFADADDDGHGTRLVTQAACEQPRDFVAGAGDCDDSRPGVYAGAIELCDDLDNDCDGRFDDSDPDLVGALLAYVDDDADGFGDSLQATPLCELRPGYQWTPGDCDDTDPQVHPNGTEVCGGADEDCDGLVDDADDDVDPSSFVALYLDDDGDGFGTAATLPACAPAEGVSDQPGDCDDAEALVYPGGFEFCDGLDNDCNGLVDDNTPPTWYRDGDGDGFGSPQSTVQACTAPAGFVGETGDCDDANPDVHPGQAELCNGLDDDCDTLVDDADDAVSGPVWYIDGDGDGFGVPTQSVVACAAPSGHVDNDLDCNDNAPLIHPLAEELCGGGDEDCDGLFGDQDPDLAGAPSWFADGDADGFGDGDAGVYACAKPQGYVSDASDCDDQANKIHPGAQEICGGVDDDCDGLIDDDDGSLSGALIWHIDADGDGFGHRSNTVSACLAPSGAVADSSDCDDGDAAISPAAVEVPGNSQDEDCSGSISCYLDGDRDGFGLLSTTVADDGDGSCTTAQGEATLAGDCDDDDLAIHPDAVEVCDPAPVDEDCDGLADDDDPSVTGTTAFYSDDDGDGIGGELVGWACDPESLQGSTLTGEGGLSEEGGDCNDKAPGSYPGASEWCDGADNDCDGVADNDPVDGTLWYRDQDADGFGDDNVVLSACAEPLGYVGGAGDCDDAQFGVNPGQTEVCDLSNTDEDCNGLADDADPGAEPADWFLDQDGDGFGQGAAASACEPPPQHVDTAGDCDDGMAAIHPDATEFAGNVVDEDCDGSVLCYLDADGDGYGADSGETVLSADLQCAAVDGESVTADDCDDAAADAHPTGTEAPGDEVDEDCDGTLLCYVDGDGDGYGIDSGQTVLSGDLWCDAVDAEAITADDCNDTDPGVNPGLGNCSGNTPPVAEFSVAPLTAETNAFFDVDAGGSTDAETQPAELEVRWDWDGDGAFDTAFTTLKTASHSYATPGVYEISVEVRDTGGLSDFQTLAINVAYAGSTLVVDNGSNDGHSEVYGGPYTNGLSFKEALILANSEPGNQTITFSGAMEISSGSRPAFTDPEGVQIVGVPGVAFNGGLIDLMSDGNTIMGIEMFSAGPGGIQFLSGSGNVVRDCVIHDSQRPFEISSPGNVIGPNNHIYGNGSSATAQIRIERPMLVVGNRIHGSAGKGISVVSTGVEIRGNHIYQHGRYGIGVDADDAVITDNTIYGNGEEGIRMLGGVGLQLENNILALNAQWGLEGDTVELATGYPDFNLWFGNGLGDCSGCTPGAGAVFEDPLLTPPSLVPAPGSPAIDAGVPNGFDRNGVAPGDFDGVAPDIGASETP